jgi:hypothetical protein
MNTIGILCERVRKEEKQLLEAFSRAGVPAVPVPPHACPVSLDSSAREAFGSLTLLIDRCPERSASCQVIAALIDSGLPVLHAGVASMGNRFAVARRLNAVGVARPATMLVSSITSGLEGLRALGYPATLMPMSFGEHPILLHDADIAEAVFEHRETLGAAESCALMLQQGIVDTAQRVEAMVVGARVVALSGHDLPERDVLGAIVLAEQAAEALGASMIGVTIAKIGARFVVWDADPIPDFRSMLSIDGTSVAQAICDLALSMSKSASPHEANGSAEASGLPAHELTMQEIASGVVLSA